MKIQRVRDQEDDNALINAIWKQNEHIHASFTTLKEFQQTVRVNFRQKLNEAEYNVILDCTPKAWHDLAKQDKLNVGWIRHNVTNHVNAKRCLKCQR